MASPSPSRPGPRERRSDRPNGKLYGVKVFLEAQRELGKSWLVLDVQAHLNVPADDDPQAFCSP